MKEGCCINLRTRLATSHRLPQKLKEKIGGTKAAILNEQNLKMQKMLYVTHIVKHMRVVKRLFKDQLKLNWNEAWQKYGPIVIGGKESDEEEDIGDIFGL